MSEKIWENLVIGSGPGGAITALTLAEAGEEVLVLEEGRAFTPDESRAYSVDDMIYKYRNGGVTAALGQPKVAYVEGRLVGGGSEVNAGLYHRTPPDVLAHWASTYALQNASPAEMEPHFAYCEALVNVCHDPDPPPPSWRLAAGADALGWKHVAAPRWIANGIRQSMSRTALPEALARGVRLESGIQVQRLRRIKAGWEVQAPGQRFHARRIYVCAGAVATPSLLLRSGISRNVGRSLQMHPSVKILAEFDAEVNFEGMGIAVHQVKEFAPRFSLGCSISTRPYLALTLVDHHRELPRLPRDWRKMAIYYAMIKPEARGRVRNLPGLPEPLVTYQTSPDDARALKAGFDALARALFAAGAKSLFGGVANSTILKGERDLARIGVGELRRDGRLMTIHLFSSCPMGEDERKTATDSFGRVWNQQNLFINDASLLCEAPGVNPQGSVMAFARRNVSQHLGRVK